MGRALGYERAFARGEGGAQGQGHALGRRGSQAGLAVSVRRAPRPVQPVRFRPGPAGRGS